MHLTLSVPLNPSPESDTSLESKSDLYLMAQACLTSVSMRSWLTQLPPEMARFLASGGTVVISRREGSISANLL